MPLKTTTIGAYPKPAYVPVPDWFNGSDTAQSTPSAEYEQFIRNAPDNLQDILDEATAEVVQSQAAFGIDIPTDGEIRRENYIFYQCRNFSGFDFDTLTRVSTRNGAWVANLPTITGDIRAEGDPILPRDFRIAQAATDNPVKITLPGPLTIVGSTANAHYKDPIRLGNDLATALNREILALADAGCKWIQVDEPIFARDPQSALAYGFEHLERCFDGLPDDVTRAVHMCCGYPLKLDDENYRKADPQAYLDLASAIDAAAFDAISLEDSHQHNDLKLLDQFKTKTVIWGSIAIAKSEIEAVDKITARLEESLQHIDADRLIVAPDCGLGYLTHKMVEAKLRNMSLAAKSI